MKSVRVLSKLYSIILRCTLRNAKINSATLQGRYSKQGDAAMAVAELDIQFDFH